MRELRGSDRVLVAEQLGREPTIPFTVVVRCRGGHPLVIRNAPLDADGAPFPTRFWLTCPEATKAVSRLESEGWISRLNERIDTDPTFARSVERAHAAYAAERATDDPGARTRGGVGGTRVGIKCLHAHYAHHLAGGDDEVGAWVAKQVEPIHDEGPGRIAAIDQGTNSSRLLIAEPRPDGGFEDLGRDLVITRLGEGVDRTGAIGPDALERTLGVLATYARRARAAHAGRIRVGATSAVRDAADRTELERRIRELTGSDLEVIAGEHEAALSFLGSVRGLEEPGPFLVLDIGGGSTEFAFGTESPTVAISTRMGSVRLTERCIRHDPPLPQELDAARTIVGEILAEVERAIPVGEAATLVALSGTSTTVQALSLGLDVDDPEQIHRTRLARSEAERVLEALAAMPTAERAALPVMERGRADVIVQGAVILVEVMRRFGFEEAVVSETDILDGLILEMLDTPADAEG